MTVLPMAERAIRDYMAQHGVPPTVAEPLEGRSGFSLGFLDFPDVERGWTGETLIHTFEASANAPSTIDRTVDLAKGFFVEDVWICSDNDVWNKGDENSVVIIGPRYSQGNREYLVVLYSDGHLDLLQCVR